MRRPCRSFGTFNQRTAPTTLEMQASNHGPGKGGWRFRVRYGPWFVLVHISHVYRAYCIRENLPVQLMPRLSKDVSKIPNKTLTVLVDLVRNPLAPLEEVAAGQGQRHQASGTATAYLTSCWVYSVAALNCVVE